MYQSIQTTTKPTIHIADTVLFTFKDAPYISGKNGDAELDPVANAEVVKALKRPEIKGELGEITPIHLPNGRKVVLVGLGETAKVSTRVMRAAAGHLVKSLNKLEATKVRLVLSAAMTEKIGVSATARALGEGLGLGAFEFDGYKKTERKGPQSLHVTTGDTADAALAEGLALADDTNFARQLQAAPPNMANTHFIVAQARALARQLPCVNCTIIDGAALDRNQLVGLINVGKASEFPPCLIQLTYQPRKAKGTVLLIGKTICYDTGGLSIKPREGMRGMKYDKSGGMAVLGAMRAIARIKPGCRVVALLPTAENSIGDKAYRVDDIIQYPNGKSVEVTNTDAEGRLVLADALLYGCKKFNPDAVIDLATLTGGVVVALGSHHAGYFCEDEKLRARLESAATASGEALWRLPLTDDHREMMKANHADLWNSAPVRDAHPIQGAAFLSNFIDAKTPWAHIDIAGTADIEKENPPFAAGPTGFGVRLLASLLENWS